MLDLSASVAIILTSSGVLWRIATDYTRLKTIQENMVTKADFQETLGALDRKFVTRNEWNQHNQQHMNKEVT
jgi:hypothetical protein